VVDEGRTLCADNGNVDLISDLIEGYANRVEPLQTRRASEEERLGHRARPGELSPALTSAFQRLARDVLERSREAVSDEHVAAVVRSQESMRPTYLIGMEDFTLVTLTGLSVEREYSDLPLEWYRPPCERAIDYAVRTRAGEFGPCSSAVFAGLHALDFDTARQAGRMAGEARLDGVAAGLVGAMKDQSFVDFRIRDGEAVDLGAAVPRPYVRTLDIAAGLHIGYAEAAGRRPAFHALGVGSPILLPLLSLLGDEQTYLAVDSTAPIKDATARTISLYVDTPAPRKLKAYRIAEFWLADNDGWRCTCPYCRDFTERHPPDPAKARVWWRGEGERALSAADMLAPSPLAEFLPILSAPGDEATARRANAARISHNHWVMKRIESSVRKQGRDPDALRRFVAETMRVYGALDGSHPGWRAAAEAAWRIAEESSHELERMSGG